jgi:catechol 2,3-dioxygenase-like lactoylglutathione lyase family enzyme
MTAPESRVAGLHGVVYVADLARCTAFYAELAGLDLVERDDGFVTLASSQVELSLVRMSGLDADVDPDVDFEVDTARRTDAAVKLSFPVVSLAAVAERAPDLGGELDDPATTWEFRGWRHRHGADPEGNVVSFREPSTRD